MHRIRTAILELGKNSPLGTGSRAALPSGHRRRVLLGVIASVWGIALLTPLTAADIAPSAPEKGSVTTLDGTKIFGVIEITDDYTIRISNDTGIKNLPIASLSQSDFLTYSGNKDRSQDGRLWSERQNALKDASQENQDPKKSEEFEIRLAELAPFQPVIAAYEKLRPPKDEKSGTSPGLSSSSPSSTLHMFTGPGSLNVPNAPFGAGLGQKALEPATAIGSGAAETAVGTAKTILPQ